MKIRAFTALIRAKYKNLPDQQKPIAILITASFTVLLLAVVIKSFMAIIHHQNRAKFPPVVIREGEKIIIPEHSPLRTKINIQTVEESDSPHIVSFPGVVEADPARTVNILPPATGRLLSLNVKLGDFVKKGQVLAVIQSPGLAQASADYEKAASILRFSREALLRAEKANRAGANSMKDVESAKNDYAQAAADEIQAKVALATLGKNKDNKLNVIAPIEGRITSLYYGRGSYISDATAPLFTLSNIKLVWVTANIPETYAGIVSKNLPAEIYMPAFPKQILHGKVSFVNSFLDPDTRRNKTRIAFKNPDGKLQPNMYATVKIALPQPNAVIVPISSVLMYNDITCVFIETKPWTFERREIELGTEDGDNTRVLAGLSAGDRVVTSGGVLVND